MKQEQWHKTKEHPDTVVYKRTIDNLQQSFEIEKSLIKVIVEDSKK
jgi:hypothetical protein